MFDQKRDGNGKHNNRQSDTNVDVKHTMGEGLVSIGNHKEQLRTSSRQTVQKFTAGMSLQAQIKMIYTDIKQYPCINHP